MPLTVGELLAADGPIAARMRELPGGGAYESRPEQTRMAEEVARTLAARGRLLVEAGTGVGKSFAYLVPAILRCIRNGEKVVIATSTIALQEQLYIKDIPLLEETLHAWEKAGESATNAEAAPGGAGAEKPKGPQLLPVLAKGRGNYLSIRRLGRASARHGILPDTESVESLHAIQDWAQETPDGTLSSLPVLQRPEVWDHVRSDSDNCMGRKCATYQKCFYQSARRELEKANLIVCNHALFFADLALRSRHGVDTEASGDAGDADPSGGKSQGSSKKQTSTAQIKAILPNYDHVIFDEAHGLEDAASEHFGLKLSMPRVMRLLRTLYSPRRRKGYLLERSLQLGNTGAVDRALTLVTQAEQACQVFFEDLLQVWRRSQDGSGRVRRPDVVDNPLTPAMRELAVALRRVRDSLEDENERFELSSLAKRASEIADCALAMIQQTLGADEAGHSSYAYWIEVEGEKRGAAPGTGGTGGASVGDEEEHDDDPGPTGRRRFGPRVTLACAPIEVAAILRRYLFDPGADVPDVVVDDGSVEERGESSVGSSVESSATDEFPAARPAAPAPKPPKRVGLVLTSATLATRKSKSIDDAPRQGARPDAAFAHAMQNLGAEGAATLQLGSPFNYRKQAKVIVDLTVPDPKRPAHGNQSRQGPSYAEGLAKCLLKHLDDTDGGAFVLFTSFATMHACADRMSAAMVKRRWPLLVHGRDGSRQQMLRRFMQEENGVLFGAASFWQGVDVRGERLRNVIITRLPFEPPDRPLVQARNERIELTGGNPFMQDSLPRAIIRFKQGFGRLIRSKTDRGQVVVMDPRIVTARYGRMFIEALPEGVPVEMIEPTPEESFESFDSGY